MAVVGLVVAGGAVVAMPARWRPWAWGIVILACVLPWTSWQDHPHWSRIGWMPFASPPIRLRDILGNTALYVPLGLFARQRRPFTRHIFGVVVASALLSVSSEATQIWSHGRFPSATDVTTNVAGAAIGVWCRQRFARSRSSSARRHASAALVSLAVIVGLHACASRPFGGYSEPSQELAWFDADGHETQVVPRSAATYAGVWLAANERTAVVAVLTDEAALSPPRLWRIDLVSGEASAIDDDRRPGDGYRITHWSPGAWIFNGPAPEGRTTVWHAAAEGAPTPYLNLPWTQRDGQLSSEGKWMAYVSEESGEPEVYAATFPDASRARWLVSMPGRAERPTWRADSQAIYYWASDGRLMETPLKRGRELVQPLAAHVFFSVPFGPVPFAVSSDGRRVLIARPMRSRRP